MAGQGFATHPENINREGRPKKGEAFTDILRSKADADEIAEKLIEKAQDGDMAALKYIYDRLDGTPRQFVQVNNPLQAEFLELGKRLLDDSDEETGEDSEVHAST